MQIKYYKFLPNSGKINLDGNVKVLLGENSSGENSSGGYSPINIIGNKRGGIDVYATKTVTITLANPNNETTLSPNKVIGGTGGAGIGGGYYNSNIARSGASNTIVINDGTVKSTGNSGGAGIGYGDAYVITNTSSDGIITIGENVNLLATSEDTSKAICRYSVTTSSYLLSNDFDTNYSVPSSNVTIKIINQEDIEKEILVRNGYISYITTVNSGIENIYTQMINYVNIVKTSTGEETFTATKTLNYIPVRLVI